jgi:GAF domain-containing protein
MRLEDATRPELLTALRALIEEREELRQKTAALEDELQRVARECAVTERENATLTHLQVANRLLHRTLDGTKVLKSIQEIIINLLGCEQIGLFEREKRPRDRLTLISSYGIDEKAWQYVALDEGLIGECARTGVMQMAGPGDRPDVTTRRPSVCVPLLLDGRTVGVLVLFKLLPHKSGLEEVDHALLELLSQQAGVALVSTYATGAWRWRWT